MHEPIKSGQFKVDMMFFNVIERVKIELQRSEIAINKIAKSTYHITYYISHYIFGGQMATICTRIKINQLLVYGSLAEVVRNGMQGGSLNVDDFVINPKTFFLIVSCNDGISS